MELDSRVARTSQRCAAPFLCLGAGSPVVGLFLLARKKVRARGTPGSRWTHGPRCLTAPRRPGHVPGKWAFRPGAAGISPAAPQVRRSSGVPRAVFEACSVRPPVDRRFQDFSRVCALDEALPTAIGLTGPARVWRPSRNGRHVLSGAQPARRDLTTWAAATDGACRPLRPPHRPCRASPAGLRKLRRRISAAALPAVPAFKRPRARPRWDRAFFPYIPIGILSRCFRRGALRSRSCSSINGYGV
jgi:hypothetical protein